MELLCDKNNLQDSGRKGCTNLRIKIFLPVPAAQNAKSTTPFLMWPPLKKQFHRLISEKKSRGSPKITSARTDGLNSDNKINQSLSKIDAKIKEPVFSSLKYLTFSGNKFLGDDLID